MVWDIICAMVKRRDILGMGDLPPFNRNPYNLYINPYYWVDEFIPYYMEISWELIDPIAHMGVSNNRGKPPKWMVKKMENPIKMDDLGVPLFLETRWSFDQRSHHADCITTRSTVVKPPLWSSLLLPAAEMACRHPGGATFFGFKKP